MAKRWTDAEIARLFDLYETHDKLEIAALLDRSPAAVHGQMMRLGIAGKVSKWTDAEERILRQHYPNGVEAVVPHLNRSRWAIKKRATILGLRVASAWTDEDEAIMRASYGVVDTGQLAAQLGRSREALHMQAKRWGLRCPTTRWKPA